MSDPDVIVAGAGAAGLWCAEVAARAGARVCVLEKTSRCGTKVLASGGTRCNLTTTLDAAAAGRLFGARGERFLRPALRALPPAAVRARFEQWGIATVDAPLEKVFPESGRAIDVRNALERAARTAGAHIEVGAAVAGVARTGAGWRVELADGTRRDAPNVVVASGGKSYPLTGTTGDGYAWLAALGLPLVEPVPALVPLLSPAPWVHELAGIAVQEAELALCDASGREVARRARPVLFTHFGLSGPAAMDVSEPVARAPALEFTARIDLVPDRAREQLRDAWLARAAQPGGAGVLGALNDVTRAALPRRLLERVVAQARCAGDARAAQVTREQRHALVEALKGFAVPIRGTQGWDKAEVTAGGLALSAVDAGTLEVKAHPGLYVIGELLDVQGPIGGLSFLAAFATAELAGRAIAARVRV
ncbi:MAG: aminoacetone oxidase family FAD-binding enzyme [Planctomycetota bacterium]|nr:MAG: aminoacetone oxidase family FAD-binding enzyme [Planctomycetota bacterium]